jgi:hypothetical protein
MRRLAPANVSSWARVPLRGNEAVAGDERTHAEVQQTLIKVYIGSSPTGKPRFDTLWVEGLPDGSYRLLRSPKNTLGIGKGDVRRVRADLAITEVLERAGNWAVQVVALEEVTPELIERLAEVAHRTADR